MEVFQVDPCEHLYCQECLEEMGDFDLCRGCDQAKKGVHRSNLLTGMNEAFDQVLFNIEQSKKQYKVIEATLSKR